MFVSEEPAADNSEEKVGSLWVGKLLVDTWTGLKPTPAFLFLSSQDAVAW